ncbi:hypothetical protein GWI33_020173 [Rhynchophorus ferrugineus]|uniref:Uncharacterized protein n=1 Tax=Rhynchophorus ferrugineus TaxID=354439 RepID=A0A834M4G7_RHYFE|nr:hypothetical protein GWI33_020173 [Rhynchophorus ferrugineus]
MVVKAVHIKESPGELPYNATTLRSRNCPSISDYGSRKFRMIRRFQNDLSWNTVSSILEYGLCHFKAVAAFRNPGNEREVLKILSKFDCHKRKERPRPFSFDFAKMLPPEER